MRHRTPGLALLLFGAAFATLALVSVACGGGDDDGGASPTATAEATESAEPSATRAQQGADTNLDSYFTDMEAIVAGAADGSAALNEQFPDAFTLPKDTADWYKAFIPYFNDVVDQMRDVDPPAAVKTEHQNFIDAGDQVPDLVETVRGEVLGLETEDDLTAYFDQDEDYAALAAALSEFQATCQALQQIADVEQIDIDLQCGEPSSSNDIGAPLGLEDYFMQLDGTRSSADDELNRLQSDLTRDLDGEHTLDEEIAILKAYLDNALGVIYGADFQLSFMIPPNEASDLHDNYITSLEDFARAMEDLRNNLNTVTTDQEANDLVNAADAETSKIKADSIQICLDLQDVADNNNIDVDLGCED